MGCGRSSAAEAALTAERLRALGIPSRVLRAELAPGPAAAERAREARYALLLGACRDAGCPDLVLGHHRADQAETVQLRGEAGSAGLGLAGMAAVGFRPEARLLRPLLTLPPERLRATLRAAGVAWVEDPTNQDVRTGRGRLRAGTDPAATAAALARAEREGAARRLSEARVLLALATVRFLPEGCAVMSEALEPDALSAVIWAISGRPYPPPRPALAAGLAPRTVHGVLLRSAGRLGPGTLVTREPSAVTPAMPARAGLVWDGRWRLGGAPEPGLMCGALGEAAPRFRRSVAAAVCGAAHATRVLARRRASCRPTSGLSRCTNVP